MRSLVVLALVGCGAPRAALDAVIELDASTDTPSDAAAAPIVTRGDTRKICQLVGDVDRELGAPTLNQTDARAGLWGTDLGASFDHAGTTYVLFGDSIPSTHFGDAIATSTDTDPSDCVALDVMTDASGAYRAPEVPGISLGEYEVPLDGIDANGAMYVWFSTARMTRSVLARSDDDGRTFAFVHDLSALHFVNVSAVRAGDDVLLFGSGAFRTSEVYLARVPAASIEDRSAYRFFDGATWSADEAAAAPLFGPACVGELSASFVPALDAYVVMHACGEPRGIQVRVARAATGPWSDAVTVFEPWADGGYCHFMHTSYAFETCDAVQDPGRDDDWGGEYAPYLVEPLVQSLGAHAAALYFTMSTWNPYTTVLMRTELSWH